MFCCGAELADLVGVSAAGTMKLLVHNGIEMPAGLRRKCGFASAKCKAKEKRVERRYLHI